MKSKVRLSPISLLLTIATTVGLIVGTFLLLWNGEEKGYIVAAILAFVLISGLIFGPISITATKDNVTVKSFMRRQHIPISGIENVGLFQPTMGAIRLFGSGGYMGYWGVFREGDIGKYVAYYGKSSECFLVWMKNGDKYVLGCENPVEMVNYIKSQL